MLLTGTYVRSLDDKGRLAFPKKLREALNPTRPSPHVESGETSETAATGQTLTLFLAPGTDGSLALYTEEVFFQLGERLGNGSPTSQGVRAFSRLFYAQAEQVELDRQGRIRIPQELATLAKLGKELVLIGVRDHLEIWDRERWQAYLEQTQPDYDQIAEQAFNRNNS